ncbi:MAG: CoA transferase [Thermoflexaceae bacterium]|nr:CoA transferase [Thermoflexaceae bacterium]
MGNQETSESPQGLEGVRILESGRFFAGPLVGTLLGDMGAEVIRYEEPGIGDPLRRGYPPLIGGKVGPYFLWSARNKKSITLDLRKPKGQELFKDLVRVSDVVTENFTPGTMAQWGLDYEQLRKVNPEIIMLSVSAYGATGPYSDRPGIDHIIQAASGLMSVTGEPDGPPTFNGVAIADYVGGFTNTYAVLTALYYKLKTGRGQWIDSALFDAATFLLEHKVLHYTALGEMAWRQGSRGLPLSRAYPAKDGEIFIVGSFAMRTSILLGVIGREEFLDDPRFPKDRFTPFDRDFLEEIDAAVAAWTLSHAIDEIEQILIPLGIMCAPVNDVAAVVDHPQYRARGNLVEVEHPEVGTLRFQGTAPKLSLTPGRVKRAAPLLGEHNRYVYCALLGHTEAEMEAWAKEGVI